MKMFQTRIALALACCLGLVGCSGSIEHQVCERADECNALTAGTSVEECTEARMKCTDSLTSTERADWEKVTEDCLELQSCSNFVGCYLAVPKC